LKDVVQTTVIDDSYSAPDRNLNLDGKLVWLIVIPILMVIIAAVTISVFIVLVTKNNSIEKADDQDQDHIMPPTNIIYS